MAERHPYLRLFAKATLVVGPLGLIAIGTQYPLRRAEAEAYASSRPCGPGVTDSSGCRLMTSARLVLVDCPRDRSLESCQLELRVDGQRRYVRLLRATSSLFKPGDTLRVEVFRGKPTAVEVEGVLERGYGSPEMAVRMMEGTAIGTVVAILVAGAYLFPRRRSS